jgi:hypothetical protein
MEKNNLKQNFRSGSRPTQEHFYSLIDACYNDNFAIYVSGYEMKTELGEHSLVKSITYEAGITHLVPRFNQINRAVTRTYHYSLPICNLGSNFRIKKISLELDLPKSANYEAKDKTKLVKISQSVTLSSIVFYNGTEAFLTLAGAKVTTDSLKEFEVDVALQQWNGITVDITVDYNIKSNIAVSDQFDITDNHADKLIHLFGGLGCEFNGSAI